MALLSRRISTTLMAMAVASAVAAVGLFNRSERGGTPPAAPPHAPGEIRPLAASRRLGSPPTIPTDRAAIPAAEGAARATAIGIEIEIEIEIDGVRKAAIDSAELARRTTNLQAADRRAWRLTELLDNTYIHSDTVIHALTIDGGDYILNENGRSSSDAIVARRVSGELYVGWLDGAGDPARPLADAELPAERIERVAKLSLVTPPPPAAEPPAEVAIIVDGARRVTVTPDGFANAATIQIRGQREGSAAAIDVSRAFGGSLAVIGLTAGGHRISLVPPRRDARPVLYLTRRARFKFAWIDASGEPIDGTKQRDVSALELATRAHLATRR